ncbi:MAG: 50S ribosomal protein L9 [Candidatus Marinimicrobia bacterium]|nr:50S ribosomal protein L9 [Candidatus Neomarinimicrobiota bacterium]RPG05186.1 MAG: 50S ribosomal protein L9 [Pelagibacteraceae bacterium TMED247]|tara:strand:- start:3658 stop:4113 length:456 start_codon:yes stop_codon:yes gene_type:complete
MNVILLENIRNLGKMGDIVKVKDGYGRNFLLKTGKALRADDENKALFKKKKEEISKKNLEQKKNAKKIFDKIKSQKLIFQKESKENGDLFASIKPKEISIYLSEKFKETIHPSQIDLKKEIKKTGNYSLTVNLHSEVIAELHVLVEKKEAK